MVYKILCKKGVSRQALEKSRRRAQSREYRRILDVKGNSIKQGDNVYSRSISAWHKSKNKEGFLKNKPGSYSSEDSAIQDVKTEYKPESSGIREVLSRYKEGL